MATPPSRDVPPTPESYSHESRRSTPEYKETTVTCSCGNTFQTGSTLGHDLQLDVCAKCHPFYTGKQKMVDTAGRVDKFRKKYAALSQRALGPAGSGRFR